MVASAENLAGTTAGTNWFVSTPFPNEVFNSLILDGVVPSARPRLPFSPSVKESGSIQILKRESRQHCLQQLFLQCD